MKIIESTDKMSGGMELVKNLPSLVIQLKGLREDMKQKSKLYESLLNTVNSTVGSSPCNVLQTVPPPPLPSPSPLSSSSSSSSVSFEMTENNERGSISTPYSNVQVDPRASQMTLDELSSLNAVLNDNTSKQYAHTRTSRQSSMMRRHQEQETYPKHHQQQHQHHHQQPLTKHRSQIRAASYSMSHSHDNNNMSMRWKMVPEQYTVIWVCGECGISLRNFSRNENKVGAQIAVLQHADGVTTGISNCRLGDQLITINTERVDALRFSQIIDMLKTTKRPISLGFRTNANMQTSPRNAPSSSTKVQNTMGESRSNHFFPRGGPVESKTIKKTLSLPVADRCLMSGDNYTNGSKSCDGDESSEVVRRTLDHSGYGDLKSKFRSSSGEATAFDCSTITSVQSSSWTLSDDLEIWCREQEEMHSDIILLLTETVMRCERLQQENLDQLQNLMQLSASSPHQRDRSGTTSSYADTEKVRNVEVD